MPTPRPTYQERIWLLGERLHDPKNAPLLTGYLTTVYNGIYSSRTALVEDAKHTTTLLSAAMGVAAAVTGLAFERYIQGSVGVAIIMALTAALVFYAVARRICPAEQERLTAAYELYMSSAIHAACVHRAAGLPLTHHWLDAGDPLNPDRYDDGPPTAPFTVDPATGRFRRPPLSFAEAQVAWKHFGHPTVLSLYLQLIETVQRSATYASHLLAACAAVAALQLAAPHLPWPPWDNAPANRSASPVGTRRAAGVDPAPATLPADVPSTTPATHQSIPPATQR